MTQGDKQLLLKDLCARLLYGVKLKIGEYSDYKLIGVIISDENPIKIEVVEKEVAYKIEVRPDLVKPYLRPMSSITKEELNDYHKIGEMSHNIIDWFNEHHFDYRHLIERGLAIAVTKENNPYKE